MFNEARADCILKRLERSCVSHVIALAGIIIVSATSHATITGSLIYSRNASANPEFVTTTTALILKCE